MKIHLPIHPENLEYGTPNGWQRPYERLMRFGRFLFIVIVTLAVLGAILGTIRGQ